MSLYIAGYIIQKMELTKAWGTGPASASIDARPVSTSPATPSPGLTVTLNIGSSVFHGLIDSYTVEETDGTMFKIVVVDNRRKLSWDHVFCSFNAEEIIEDDLDTVGIDRKKRFVHILPADWALQIRTFTDGPLTARQILEHVFGADSVRQSWNYALTHALFNEPAYDIDANNGKTLGNVIQEVLDAIGLTVTIEGERTLIFAVKGDGTVPIPGGSNSTNRTDGAAAAAETSIRVVGERNLYQATPVELEPDWLPALQGYWFKPLWVEEVIATFDGLTGPAKRAEAEARAREITLREYATAKSDTTLLDRRTWSGVSRLDLPVWVYLSEIVFRVYRIPSTFAITVAVPGGPGHTVIPLQHLDIHEGGMLQAVEWTVEGAMSYDTASNTYPESPAFVIVKGQPLDLLDPVTSDAITPELLENARTKWQANNRFNIDAKEKTINFQQATFIPGEGADNLFIAPNRTVDEIPADLRNIVVPNANAVVTPAEVRASIVFEGDKFHASAGSGYRAKTFYVRGLNRHVLQINGTEAGEVRFADGEMAAQKAAAAAAALLVRETVLRNGGFTRHGVAGMALNGSIDRATVTLSFTGGEDDGITERIDYSKERAPSTYETERELERRQRARDLFPGQEALKEDARKIRLIAQVRSELATGAGGFGSGDTRYADLGSVPLRPAGGSAAPAGSIVQVRPADTAPEGGYPVGAPIFVSMTTPADGDDKTSGRQADPEGKVFGGVVTCAGITT